MKILVVSNLYPPHHIGGYELGCRDVVEKLRGCGHEVRVLTSSFRNEPAENTQTELLVERTLQFNHRPDDPPHNKQYEAKIFRSVVNRFRPDVVYFWNLAGLSLWLPFAAHRSRCRLAFFLSDTNFVFWRIGAWLRWWGQLGHPVPSTDAALGDGERRSAPSLPDTRAQIIAHTIHAFFGNTFLVQGWPVVRNQTCHFCSDFLRHTAIQNGIAVSPNSIVAHWGIEPDQFPPTPRLRWPVRRLLYAGQLVPIKGVHTAITAFATVAREPGFEDLTFTVAGGGMHADYERQLRALPAQLGVAGRVQFLGKVPRADLPRIYAAHDVLVFPSEWDEPFAITPLEAMASGLAVVGTTTGGSGELFRDRETALTFRAGDAADGARALRELATNRELFAAISANGQRVVREKHTLDAMVDRIEKSLQKMLTSGKTEKFQKRKAEIKTYKLTG
jgi:glycogen synthase